MTPESIATALGQALESALDDNDVAWPNRSADPERPFVDFQHVPTVRRDPTLAGTAEIAEGYMVATVVTDRGSHATQGERIAALIMAAFRYTTRLSLEGGGQMVVTAPPRTLPAFDDGAAWRTPVRIDYRTT